MKDELAQELLARVMEWTPAQLAEYGPQLQVLARLKYDDYEGFRPGEKFLESLSRWLSQFEVDERRTAVRFILRDLTFISRAELEHAIGLVYPDFIRPMLREHVAAELGIPGHLLKRIVDSTHFEGRQRRMIVLGLADGARLDRLRRACPRLSHEQFSLVPDMSDPLISDMRNQLEKALAKRSLPGPAVFQHVLLVDDFSGSGFTLIREENSAWEGKLIKAQAHIQRMQALSALETPAQVSLLLYVANGAALTRVRDQMDRAGLSAWTIDAVQKLPDNCKVTDASIRALCEHYYDPSLDDEHKGSAVFGFREVALPLVLSHNTPNDSIALLWGDTADLEIGLKRHALFPRYERHHVARP